MAYYSGSANDMTAVRQALIDACTQPEEGWSWDGTNEVLGKGAMFVRLQVVGGYLTLLGRTSATAGSAPNVVRIGQLSSTPLSWPVTYEIFAFEDEVFMVINYSIDLFQYCAFGLSSVSGLPGSGMWISATLAITAPSISISPTGGGSSGTDRVCPALFWSVGISAQGSRNNYVHSDLDGDGWLLAPSGSIVAIGIGASVPLIGLLPNSWNSEAVLLPIRAYKTRPSNRISLTVDVNNARYTRIDNYEPKQVINIGPDRWKIFPWYLKNSGTRDGGPDIQHTGTFGWAVRYEGP